MVLASVVLLGLAALVGVEGQSRRFQLDALEAHNEKRRLHGAPDLKLNNALCAFAYQWAKHLLELRRMQHRPKVHDPFGENIYWKPLERPEEDYDERETPFKPIYPTAEQAVQGWYDEAKEHEYDYDREPYDWKKTGHFSQVVWKATKEVGCGIASDEENSYIVCNYFPHGNFKGSYRGNVTAPIYNEED